MLNSASTTRGLNEKQISSSYKTLTILSLQLHVVEWSEFVHIEKICAN